MVSVAKSSSSSSSSNEALPLTTTANSNNNSNKRTSRGGGSGCFVLCLVAFLITVGVLVLDAYEVVSVQVAKDAARNTISSTKKQIGGMKILTLDEYNNMLNETSTAKEQYQVLTQQVAQQRAELDAAQKEAAMAQEQYNTLNNQAVTTQADLDAARQALVEKQALVDALTVQAEQLQEQQLQSLSLQSAGSGTSSSAAVEQCRQAFLAGVEPRATAAQRARIASSSPEWQTTWLENNCDELFCLNNANQAHNNANAYDDEATSENELPCQWSHFAIQNLVPSNTAAAASRPSSPPGGGVVFCNAPDQLEQFYVRDAQWENYAFADFFLGGRADWDWFAPDAPPGSLMQQYHNVMVQYPDTEPNNYTLLQELIDQRLPALPLEETPLPNTLLIHLRLGDTVDCAVDSVHELLFQQCYYYRGNRTVGWYTDLCLDPGVKRDNDQPLLEEWNAYVLPLSNYAKLRLQDEPYDSIVIMGSSHQDKLQNYARNATKSCLYTVALQNYFARFSNLKVTLRLAHTPDEDIVFASQVKGFVQSGGGYSRVLAELVRMSGGTVYSV
jgi:hypothetical protein